MSGAIAVHRGGRGFHGERSMSVTQYTITVEQLIPGLFIVIDKDKCPFRKNQIKIKDEKQIARIKAAGLTHVNFVLEKSDGWPLPPEGADKGSGGGASSGGAGAGAGAAAAPEDRPAGAKTPVSFELLGLKKETVEKNKERRQAFAKCEKRYDQTMGQVGAIMRRISGRSGEAAGEAVKVVDALVNTFLSDRDTMISLMQSKPGEDQKNYHSLNVTVLAMMLGKEMKMKAEAMQALGMGCLLHDIGKGRVPMQAVSSKGVTTISKAADKYLKEHPIIGARLAADLQEIPKAAVAIIAQHHERVNGSGYPRGLKGDKVSPFAGICAVADVFDNLVNRAKPGAKPGAADGRNLTPHEALKHMFSRMKASLDARFLQAFVRLMGVYPAGTCVELSNGQMGMVVTTNPRNAARPTVLMYHPEVPKREALMVDLAVEDTMEITRFVRPDELSREVFAYLSPSNNINYYADNVPEGG